MQHTYVCMNTYVCTSLCTHQKCYPLHNTSSPLLYICTYVRMCYGIPNNSSSHSSLNCVVYFTVNKEMIGFLRGSPSNSVQSTYTRYILYLTYVRTYVYRFLTIWMSSKSPWISPPWRRRSTHTSTSLSMTSRETSRWCGVTP